MLLILDTVVDADSVANGVEGYLDTSSTGDYL